MWYWKLYFLPSNHWLVWLPSSGSLWHNWVLMPWASLWKLGWKGYCPQYILFLASSPDGNHKHKYLIGKDFYPHIFQSPHFFLPAFKSEQFIIISRATPINRNTSLLFSCCLQILKHWNKCLILHYLSAYLCAEILQWIYLSLNWTRVLCAWFIRIIICSETADLVRYFTFRSFAPEDSIVFLSYSTAQ